MDFIVLVSDIAEMMIFATAVAALATSFARKFPSSRPRLALRVRRRFTSEVIRLGGPLHFFDATVLLSFQLSTSM